MQGATADGTLYRSDVATFTIEVDDTAAPAEPDRELRFDVETSSGGNGGAREIRVYAPG